MSNRIFNQEQIEVLLQNPNVARCSEKSISYHKDFKVLTIKKYQEGLPPLEIFKQAQFDIDLIGRETPRTCLRRWRKALKDKRETGLKIDGRGKHKSSGRPKNLSNLSDEEKLKRLEAEVAYLKEENRFLAKLRKKSLN
ncbi:hypothetical protein KJ684_00535 [Patescibacteria group bacterium]|nr:hypothetical protein [Patescibacteria group bacterium]